MLTEFNFLSPEKSGSSKKLSSSKQKKSSSASKYPLTSTQIHSGDDSLLGDEGNPFNEEAAGVGSKKKKRRSEPRVSVEERVFQRQLEEAVKLSKGGHESSLSSTLPLSEQACSSPLEVMDIIPPAESPLDDDQSTVSNKENNKIKIISKSKKPLILIDSDDDDDFPEGPVSLKTLKKNKKPLEEPLLKEPPANKTKASDKKRRKSEGPSSPTSKKSKRDDPKNEINLENEITKSVVSEPRLAVQTNSSETVKSNVLESDPSEKNAPSTSKDGTKRSSKRSRPKFEQESDYDDDAEDPESEEEYSPVQKPKKSSKKKSSPEASKKKSSTSKKKDKKEPKLSSDTHTPVKPTASAVKKPSEAMAKNPLPETRTPDPPAVKPKPTTTPSVVKKSTEVVAKNPLPKTSTKSTTSVGKPSVVPKEITRNISSPRTPVSSVNKVVPSTTPKSVPRTLKPVPKWTPPGQIGQSSNNEAAKSSPSLGIRVGLSRKFKAAKPLHSNVKLT